MTAKNRISRSKGGKANKSNAAGCYRTVAQKKEIKNAARHISK